VNEKEIFTEIKTKINDEAHCFKPDGSSLALGIDPFNVGSKFKARCGSEVSGDPEDERKRGDYK